MMGWNGSGIASHPFNSRKTLTVEAKALATADAPLFAEDKPSLDSSIATKASSPFTSTMHNCCFALLTQLAGVSVLDRLEVTS